MISLDRKISFNPREKVSGRLQVHLVLAALFSTYKFSLEVIDYTCMVLWSHLICDVS